MSLYHPPLSLCHPPGAMAASFLCSGLPKKSTSGCGRKQKAGRELALEHLHLQLLLTEGQKQRRIIPGQSSATLFRAGAKCKSCRKGLGMQTAFKFGNKFGGKIKYEAQVGFYTQDRAGS